MNKSGQKEKQREREREREKIPKEKKNEKEVEKGKRLNEAVEEIRYWFPRAKHSFVLTAEIFR